jgi:hypothetical protein
MAHVLDTKYRWPTTANTTVNGTTITFNYTCGAGTTVLVLCFIYANGTRSGAPTYNGVPLTQADITRYAASSPEARAELWYLLAPPTGSSLQFSIANANGLAMAFHVSSYKAAAGRASALDVTNGATGTSTNPTASVTTTVDGDVLVSVVASGLNSWAPSPQDGTVIYNDDNGTWGGGSQYYLQATLGTKAMGWTAATEDWGLCVASFKEVSVTYNETGRSQAITMGQSRSDLVVASEVGRAQNVSLPQSQSDVAIFPETNRAQAISAALSRADAVIANEADRQQALNITQPMQDILTAIETGRAQAFIIQQDEQDVYYPGWTLYDETSRPQAISVAQAIAEVATAAEGSRSQAIILAQVGADTLLASESGVQALLVSQQGADRQAYAEVARLQAVTLLQAGAGGLIAYELGRTQPFDLVQGQADAHMAAEIRTQAFVIAQIGADAQTAAETRGQSLLVAQAGADVLTALEMGSQPVLIVLEESDVYLPAGAPAFYDETGKAQTLLMTQAALDSARLIEAGAQAIAVGHIGADSLIASETGRAILLLVGQGATDIQGAFEEGRVQAILISQAEADSLIGTGGAIVLCRRRRRRRDLI